MATRTSKAIRSGVIGFVAGAAALGVAASAQPVHSVVSSAIGVQPRHDRARADDRDGRRAQDQPKADGGDLWTPSDGQGGQDDWSLPQDPTQGGDQWQLPQDQSQQQPYVQPAPQQAPQSQAS